MTQVRNVKLGTTSREVSIKETSNVQGDIIKYCSTNQEFNKCILGNKCSKVYLVWLFQPKCLQQLSILLLFLQLCQRSWPLSNVQNIHRQHIKLNRFPGFNTWHLNTLFIEQFIKFLRNTKNFGDFKNVNLIINSQGHTLFAHARHWYSKPIAMNFPVIHHHLLSC